MLARESQLKMSHLYSSEFKLLRIEDVLDFEAGDEEDLVTITSVVSCLINALVISANSVCLRENHWRLEVEI